MCHGPTLRGMLTPTCLQHVPSREDSWTPPLPPLGQGTRWDTETLWDTGTAWGRGPPGAGDPLGHRDLCLGPPSLQSSLCSRGFWCCYILKVKDASLT